MSYRRHTIVPLEHVQSDLKKVRSFFSLLRRGLVIRLSAIASDLNENIRLLCLRSSAIRPTQTASDGRRPLQIIWKPGFSYQSPGPGCSKGG